LANTYNYGQKGVSTDLQFGKRGPRLVANASTSALQVTTDDGNTLTKQCGIYKTTHTLEM
jgi:hypothetical protein